MNVPPHHRATVPTGLLGLITLIVAIECLAIHGNPAFSSLHSASWRWAGRAIGKARKCDVLCFGDSLLKLGINARMLKRQTGRKTYNLAMLNGSAPASYFLLRRALNAGARPSIVLVDFAWGQLSIRPATPTRIFPWADLLTLREIVELALAERDPGFFASMIIGEILPSYRSRDEIRANILAALDGRSTDRSRSIPLLQQTWDDFFGHHRHPKVAAYLEDIPEVVGPPQKSRWRCDPTNALYVRKFLDLAADHGIEVFWIMPPVHPGYQAYRDHIGDDAAYAEFIRAVRVRSSRLTVIDARRSGFAATDFVDTVHLNVEGSAALTLALGRLLRRHVAGMADEARWVALPAADRQPINEPIARIARSQPPETVTTRGR